MPNTSSLPLTPTFQFDDRPNAQVLTEYRHLNYNNVTVEHQGSKGDHYRGIFPYSKPHYGIAYPANTHNAAVLSLEGTKTTSFDFYSVEAGCISPLNIRSGYEALACNISIECATSPSFELHYGPTIFEYVPSEPFGAELMLMVPSGYEFCQEMVIRTMSDDTVLVVDQVTYTIREGECIPGSPGDLGPKCKN